MSEYKAERSKHWMKLFPQLESEEELNDILKKCSNKGLEEFEKEYKASLQDKEVFNYNKEYSSKFKTEVNKALTKIEERFRWAYFFRPLILSFVEELYNLINKLDSIENKDEFWIETVAQIINSMSMIVLRTLVYEITRLREENKLIGNIPEERGDYFKNVLLRSDKYIKSVYEKYPELVRVTTIIIKEDVDYISKILLETSEEINNLVKVFNLNESEKLIAFSLSSGDTHNNGKSVSILTFKSGKKLLYKPRDMEIDLAFDKFIKWLNGQNIDGYYNLTLPKLYGNKKKDGAWVEFIENKECESEEEVKRFYNRIGEYLCIFHLFSSTDFHYENIIAQREYPILVDLETILNPKISFEIDEYNAFYMANKIVLDSIYSTCLLPRRIISMKNKRSMDISGLSGNEKQESRLKGMGIENYTTDEVKIVKKYLSMEPQKNNPVFNGKIVESEKYINEIKYSFIKLYKWIMCNKSILKSTVISLFEDKKCRVVIRATNIYAQMLNTSYHPQLLMNSVDRKVYLSRIALGLSELMKKVVKEEYKQLLIGDVPYFSINTSGKNLLYGKNGIVKDAYECCILDDIKEQIMAFNEIDLERQVSIINISFENKIPDLRYNYTDNKFCLGNELYEFDRKKALKIAEDVGDYLIRKAIKGRCNGKDELMWIGSKQMEYGAYTQPISMGIDLYDGNAGEILFLSYLYKKTKKEKFKKAAVEALNPIINALKELNNKQESVPKRLSAYYGAAGYIFTLFNCGICIDNKGYIDFAHEKLNELKYLIGEEEQYDIIGGQAGILLVAAYFYEIFTDEKTKNEILELMGLIYEQLKKKIVKSENGFTWGEEGLISFAHGNAGVEAALIEYWSITKKEETMDIIKMALKFDRKYFNEEKGGWPRSSGSEVGYENHWCNGNGGILLSRVLLLKAGFTDECIEDEISFCIKQLCEKGFGKDFSLCHGDLGNLFILYRAAKILKNDILEKQVITTLEKYLDKVEDDKVLDTEFKYIEKNGIMVGVSGIGYALLKFLDYEDIPDILCFK